MLSRTESSGGRSGAVKWYEGASAGTAILAGAIAVVLPLVARDSVLALYLLPSTAVGLGVRLFGGLQGLRAHLVLAGLLLCFVVLPSIGYGLATLGV
jgi:hypothetical protein